MVGFMVKSGSLSMDEVEIIAFRAQRVLHNNNVLRYMGLLKSDFSNPNVVRRPIKAHENALYLSNEISKKKPYVEPSTEIRS
jgi:hypothetical protein